MSELQEHPNAGNRSGRRALLWGGGAVALAGLCAVAVVALRGGDGSGPTGSQSSDARTGPHKLGLNVRLDPRGRTVSVRGTLPSAAQADLVRSAAYGIDSEATIDLTAPDGATATGSQERSVGQLVALMSALPSHMSTAEVTLNDIALTVIGDSRGRSTKADMARLFDRMEASGIYVRRNIAVPCKTSAAACLGIEVERSIGPSGVRFDAGSSALSGVGYEAVEDVSFLLGANPGVRVVVVGRARATGGPQRLAKARADEVAAVITDHEIDPSRVTVRTAPGGGDRVEISLSA